MTPAGTSTNPTSKIDGMTTHKIHALGGDLTAIRVKRVLIFGRRKRPSLRVFKEDAVPSDESPREHPSATTAGDTKWKPPFDAALLLPSLSLSVKQCLRATAGVQEKTALQTCNGIFCWKIRELPRCPNVHAVCAERCTSPA